MAHFTPESLAHFAPESLAHFAPEYSRNWDSTCVLWKKLVRNWIPQVCFVNNPGAHMMIHSGMEAGISCWNISGRLENFGRIDITNADQDGFVLSGSLLNQGRIYINGIQVRNIVSLDGSVLENQGLMINK